MPSTTTKISRNAIDSTPPAKPGIEKIERFISSCNVFADLGLRNPESLKRKSALMMYLEKRNSSPQTFAKRICIANGFASGEGRADAARSFRCYCGAQDERMFGETEQ
jgi:hypothetical protein